MVPKGSIKQVKSGRWEGRMSCRGESKYVSGETREEVEGKLDFLRSLYYDTDYNIGYASGKLSDWIDYWYKTYKKDKVSIRTQEFYEYLIEYQIKPRIGDIRVNKLRSYHVQTMINDMMKDGRRDVKNQNCKEMPGLSAKTVRSTFFLLNSAMRAAQADQLIFVNPCTACQLPKKEYHEMKTLRPEDIQAYLQAAEEFGELPMLYLELVTGIRRGELIALEWKDLDVERRMIRITKGAVREKNAGITLHKPKTKNSIRSLYIPNKAVELLLLEHSKHPNNTLMFPSPVTGGLRDPKSVSQINAKVLQRAGLEHIRFHDLRHTFATNALLSGVDIRTVSAMLGHYSAGFTLDTYVHVLPQMPIEAADTIEKFMYKYGNGNYLYPNDTRAKIIAMNRIEHENLRKVEPTK